MGAFFENAVFFAFSHSTFVVVTLIFSTFGAAKARRWKTFHRVEAGFAGTVYREFTPPAMNLSPRWGFDLLRCFAELGPLPWHGLLTCLDLLVDVDSAETIILYTRKQ